MKLFNKSPGREPRSGWGERRRPHPWLNLKVNRTCYTQPIDRPFRLSLDFGMVWAVLAVPTVFLIHRADIGPWFSQAAALILLPLFGTFVLYGPVLLVRQIVESGSRGRFVARVLVSFLLIAAPCAAIMFFTGHGEHPPWWCGAASSVAIVYLHWRLEPRY